MDGVGRPYLGIAFFASQSAANGCRYTGIKICGKGSVLAWHATKKDVAEHLRSFLDGTGSRWDWDDFLCSSIVDPELERIRSECALLPDRYPPHLPSHYCNSEGIQRLRSLLLSLES
jgi:hypothetical protein